MACIANISQGHGGAEDDDVSLFFRLARSLEKELLPILLSLSFLEFQYRREEEKAARRAAVERIRIGQNPLPISPKRRIS
jgi:hypothetical protein